MKHMVWFTETLNKHSERILPSPLTGGEAETGKGPADLFPPSGCASFLRTPGRKQDEGVFHQSLESLHPLPNPPPSRGRELNRMLLSRLSGGFTLIEVLVVVVILSILAALIVPRIMDRPDQARIIAAKSDIQAVTNALKLYRLDNGVYPTTEQGLQALSKKPETGEIPRNWKSSGYLDRLPRDPWKNDYQYLNPGLHGEIDVFSFGADGQPGGDGINADIGSWNIDY